MNDEFAGSTERGGEGARWFRMGKQGGENLGTLETLKSPACNWNVCVPSSPSIN